MSRYRKLTTICCAAVFALGLAACGGGGSPVTDPTTPSTPTTPVNVSGTLELTGAQASALLAVLPNSGDTATINIPEGETRQRQGVRFSCNSAYPCGVTLENSAGTIVVKWSSQRLGTGTASVSLPPQPADTFAELNDGSTNAIRDLIAPATDNPTPIATELTGMGLGGMGAVNADKAGLRSNFDPNSANTGGTAGAVGAANGLTGGSMLTGKDDGFAGGDIAGAPTGWVMKTLFRDWGDTAGDGDGGFETGAIVVKNFGSPAPHPWDAKLAGRFVNPFDLPGVIKGGGNNPYEFTVDSDGDGTNDAVAFTVDANSDTPGGMGSHVDANAAGAGSLAITVTSAEDGAFKKVLGQFLGVRGEYTCGETDCALSRKSGTDNFTLGTGSWQFKPGTGAMVQVPDQDWMVYGAWMTTPDNPTGVHRVGTFFNGFDVYQAGSNFAADNENGLHGTATYKGGAAGIYVDGSKSGLFTATAMLTANFDVDGNGTSDAGDYTISGRIDDFRGTDGVYLGTDTKANPNDPVKGGENDWVVLLASSSLADIGTASNVTGSADGVQWTGNWSGSLFGPTLDDDDAAVAPSGVAGEFRASTAAIGTPAARNTGVVGTFGATLQPPASN